MVIPAHNEERVIGYLVSDLRSQDYPADAYRTWVLADRCQDGTAAVAEQEGARVVERRQGSEGKGELLKWHLAAHPLQPEEALVVLDADNRIPPSFLSDISDALAGGAQVVQASVLPSNPHASPIAAAAGLGDWMARELIYKPKAARGWPIELGGTGLCVTARALREAGGWSGSFTEDLDLTVRLLLVGHRVEYLFDTIIWDEKPINLRSAVGQRRRWAVGRTQVRRRRGPKLWRAALAKRSLPMMALALRMAAPGRSFRWLAALLMGVFSVVGGWGFPFSWPIWGGILLWLGVGPLVALGRVKEVRPYLQWYPLTLIWGLVWLWVRITPSGRGWFHTPHHGG